MTTQVRAVAAGAMATLVVLLVVFAALALVPPGDVSPTGAVVLGAAGNALAGVVGGAVGGWQASGAQRGWLAGFAGPALVSAVGLAALATQGSWLGLVQSVVLASGALAGVWMASNRRANDR